jgi:hypothetical protein
MHFGDALLCPCPCWDATGTDFTPNVAMTERQAFADTRS